MASRTVYGKIIKISEKRVHFTQLSNATFRLHIASDISDADIRIGLPMGTTQRFSGRFDYTILLADHPSAGVMYERQLHVGKATDHEGQEVAHLKEDVHFMETRKVGIELFLGDLTVFLCASIPELQR